MHWTKCILWTKFFMRDFVTQKHLAYEIYYVDIITFVYKMSLFCPHNAPSAFSLLSTK